MLKEGQKAPNFSLEDQEGKIHKLSDYKGKKVVLYFYPKDNTPGCTTEACDFQDNLSRIKKDAVVFGISADSVSSHKKFAEKQNLSFPLLSDPDHTVLKSYGAWGEKSMYGRLFMGIIRSTFVIDEKGLIIKVFPMVRVKGHVQAVIDFLKS